MNNEVVIRQVLSNSKEFKHFWEKQGPFRFALTSSDFPPVLLEPEEWIFSNNIGILLKELMQFEKRKMEIVNLPFNPLNKKILRPDDLIPWKIINFPEEWNAMVCDCFIPEGHLTRRIFKGVPLPEEKAAHEVIEKAFINCLSDCVEQLGYILFRPFADSKVADIKKYLTEWEEDDQDAGLL